MVRLGAGYKPKKRDKNRTEDGQEKETVLWIPFGRMAREIEQEIQRDRENDTRPDMARHGTRTGVSTNVQIGA